MLVDYAKARFKESYDNYQIGEAIGKGWDIFEQSAYISQVLTQLNILDLSNTQVTDLSPLSVLTQLNRLYLNDTQVTTYLP